MKEYFLPFFASRPHWTDVPAIHDFSSPWTSGAFPATAFQAYHDGILLYFRFVADGPAPKVWVKENHKMEVLKSERVELFFRRDEAMKPYFCLEMDPHGRVLDYESAFYRQSNRAWQWPHNLQIKAHIGTESYTVEGVIRLSALEQLGVLHKNEMQVGVYRGHCTRLENDEATLEWYTWVDPKTETPDFHVPASFGRWVLENMPD